MAILLVGISFVAMLTGAIAQRFLSSETGEAEASLETGEESIETTAIRELAEIQSRINSLQVSVGRLVEGRVAGSGRQPD